jgi:hypothetical protein
MCPESVEYNLQPLPMNEWEETRNTLHLYLQIVGKVRMYASSWLNHWWHVPFSVSARGLSTGPIPWKRRYFDMEFDLIDHTLNTRISDGFTDSISLQNLSVAGLYRHVLFTLMENGIELDYREPHPETPFSDTPFEDNRQPAPYDPDYVHRFWVILRQVDIIFQKFRGGFTGKSSPSQLFWHDMDLAMTRFSGRKSPDKKGAGALQRQAFSHELIAFGFRTGDLEIRAPAFYGYAAPVPEGLYDEPLVPEEASWNTEAGMALMMYDDIRESRNAESKILVFLESVYQAAAKKGGWDIEVLKV